MEANRGADALNAALRLLSYRQRSVAELELKLKDKGFSQEEIAGAVEYLKDAGYLDDEAYAAALAQSRVRNKSWGPAKISADLAKKGIPPELARKAVEDVRLEQEATARAALEKWMRANGRACFAEDRGFERAFRHLKARGFDAGVIMNVLGPFRKRGPLPE